jgi:hypothetical protein
LGFFNFVAAGGVGEAALEGLHRRANAPSPAGSWPPVVQDMKAIFQRHAGVDKFLDGAHNSTLCEIAAWVVIFSYDENARMATSRAYHQVVLLKKIVVIGS